MRCETFEVDYGGPALVQAVSGGVLNGPGDRPIACLSCGACRVVFGNNERDGATAAVMELVLTAADRLQKV